MRSHMNVLKSVTRNILKSPRVLTNEFLSSLFDISVDDQISCSNFFSGKWVELPVHFEVLKNLLFFVSKST